MSKKLIAGAGVVASFAIALAPLATFATDHLYPNSHQDRLSVTLEKVCSFGYDYTDGDDVPAGLHTDGDGTNSGKGTGTVHGTAANADKTAGKNYGKWDVTEGAVSTYDTVLGDSTADPADPLYTAYNAAPGTGTEGAKKTVVTDTAYGIMENKTKNETFAKTKLNVVCNNIDGYTITAESTDLTGSGLPAIAQTNALDETSASTWSFKYTAVANANSETAATVEHVRTLTYGSSTASTWDAAKTKKPIITMAKASGTTGTENAATPRSGDSYEITYGVAIDSVQPAGTYEGTITYVLAQTL